MIQSRDENNPVIKIIEKIKLLLPNGDNNLAQRVVAVRQLVSFLENIISSKATTEVFFYLLEHGAATSWLLQVELLMPESSVYRALKRLRQMDIIINPTRIRHQYDARGGPRPYVWALRGTPPEKSATAIRKHQRALSPKYRVAEQFVQDVLEPHLRRTTNEPGITFNQIIRYTRGHTAPYRNRDIADLAVIILQEKGVKVWR